MVLPHAKTSVEHSQRIGFIVAYPFHFFVYKNVYEQFHGEAEFVVDLGIHPGRPPAPNLEHEIVSLLEHHRVRYRILRYEDYGFPRYLEQFFAPYAALVSLWEQGCIRLPCNSERKKINLIYGCGKDLTFLRPSRGIYDLIVAYGKHDYDLVSQLSPAVMVGNPKFDSWFKKKHATKKDTRGKTLLYLPTHGDLSSIDQLARELTKLPSDWRIIAKLHYYTPREEPHRVHALTHPRIELHKDDADVLELLEKSDVVLSDNSSAIFDAILADKPTVVADFWDAEYLDTTHQNARWYRRGMTAGTTYSDSIEQRVKRDGSVHTIRAVTQLDAVLHEALTDSTHFKERRAELRRELFAYTDGSSSRRTADAIRACIRSTAPIKRPILHYAYEAYKVRAQQLPYKREMIFQRKIATLESALRNTTVPLPSIRIILLCPKKEAHSQALRSLLEQDYRRDAYSLSVLSQNANERLLDERLGEKNISITYINVPHEQWGKSIALALSEAEEDYVFFTTNMCVVPRDTLWRLSLAMQKSNVTGAGGYVRHESLLDSVSLLRTQRILGVSDISNNAPLPTVEHSYLEKHPMGDIRCSMYKRTSLAGVYLNVQDISEAGVVIRAYASRRGSLVFEPLFVVCGDTYSFFTNLRTAWVDGYNRRRFGGERLTKLQSPIAPRAMVYEVIRFGIKPSIRFWLSELVQWIGFVYACLRVYRTSILSQDDGWIL